MSKLQLLAEKRCKENQTIYDWDNLYMELGVASEIEIKEMLEFCMKNYLLEFPSGAKMSSFRTLCF